jgi:hypothetical protein
MSWGTGGMGNGEWENFNRGHQTRTGRDLDMVLQLEIIS